MPRPEQLLKVRLRSVFVVDEKSRVPRWKNDAETVIANAEVKIPKHHRLAEWPTDPQNGETRLNIHAINTPFIVQIDPPAVSLSDQPAGPLLGPPGLPRKAQETAAEREKREEIEKQQGVMLRRRYRPLEILVYPRKGHLHHDLPPRVVEGMTHGRVIRHAEWDQNLLDIDWKPDWISIPTAEQLRVAKAAKRSQERDDEPIYKADDPNRKQIAKASEFLAAGKWVILIHRTTVNVIGSTLNEFIENWKAKGVHYIIDLDGHIVKLIDDRAYVAWHTGPSQWRNESPVNAFSIGIEIVNKTGDKYTHAQMASLLRLVDQLRKTYKISRDRVLAHGEVRGLVGDGKGVNNPRENCPGFEFDWTILEKNGHATYPSFREEATLPPGFDEFFLNKVDDALSHPNSDKDGGQYGKSGKRLPSGRSDLVAQLQRNLGAIGYERLEGTIDFKNFSVRTEKILRRFQARYMSGPREKYLGDKQADLGKANLYTIVMMQAVLTAQGQQWRTA
jgi:N-acetyl-anhydromuramyl-L-alanine amidase AmpD